MRTRHLPLIPLTAAALAVCGCGVTATTDPAPSETTAPPSTSTAPAGPVDLEILVQWDPADKKNTAPVSGGANLFVDGRAAGVHTRQSIPSTIGGADPLILPTQADPGESVQVIVSTSQLDYPGELTCQIRLAGTDTILAEHSGNDEDMPMTECSTTAPATVPASLPATSTPQP